MSPLCTRLSFLCWLHCIRLSFLSCLTAQCFPVPCSAYRPKTFHFTVQVFPLHLFPILSSILLHEWTVIFILSSLSLVNPAASSIPPYYLNPLESRDCKSYKYLTTKVNRSLFQHYFFYTVRMWESRFGLKGLRCVLVCKPFPSSPHCARLFYEAFICFPISFFTF